MTVVDLLFRPLVPPWLLAILAGVVAVALLLALFGRLPAAHWRVPPLVLLLGVLANPVLFREEREPLRDVALVVEDASPSMAAGDRPELTDAVLEAVGTDLARDEGLEVVTVTVEGGADGTALVGAVERALGEIDPRRLAGTVIVSDGQVHDVPAELPDWVERRPVHHVIPGGPEETDRRLVLEDMPSYAMVGEEERFTLTLEDDVGAGGGDGGPERVTVRQNGRVIHELVVVPGRSVPVPFEVERAGETVVEVEVAPRDGEISTLNNRTTAFVTGVRDRLRVLLVSGVPYQGLRVWRNLLKADPAVDLVHFTILRPPEKQDGTPVRELALIAFPVRELFELKLGEFDLIVFDRYARRGLLPLAYLENVARYVEGGGALLINAGPDFATPLSLARTPLDRVIPLAPSGQVIEQPFRPRVTELGGRHPVTDTLRAQWDGDWGPWFRQIDVEQGPGQIVLRGAADRPLLVLDRVGDGRVAQLLSDHAWLWARGFEEGGPQQTLLRRLVHWLMQEPELEEERLIAEPGEDAIRLERVTLDPEPQTATATTPTGDSFEVELTPGDDGRLTARVPAAEPGLYRFDQADGRRAFAAVRPMAPKELEDLRATAAPLAPLVEASGGVQRFTDEAGIPEVRRVGEGRTAAGRGWIGLVENDRFRVVGSAETALLPAWLALILLVGTQVFAWWREGRR
ncbi:MAG: hypothetical protein GVY33_09405 [Alphaproteobacteria bacterium]|jgi:hypothetical protein|nr:hypothetical protein [Alphaproteobacteria bacterium]